jgi:cyclopropane-fatty-acyl-phospholipid synthase
LKDYRDVEGSYDRIVSIEMLEAVGEAYWQVYFNTLHDRLNAGGIAVLQVITIDEARFSGYRRSPDFIQRHIFPGGMLPTKQIIADHAEAAGLKLVATQSFGDSYAKTLTEWRKRFVASWPRIEAMGFSDRFRRLWEYYLCYCEAGFRAGTVDVGFYVLAKP